MTKFLYLGIFSKKFSLMNSQLKKSVWNSSPKNGLKREIMKMQSKHI